MSTPGGNDEEKSAGRFAEIKIQEISMLVTDALSSTDAMKMVSVKRRRGSESCLRFQTEFGSLDLYISSHLTPSEELTLYLDAWANWSADSIVSIKAKNELWALVKQLLCEEAFRGAQNVFLKWESPREVDERYQNSQ